MEISVVNANKGANKNRGRKYRRCKFTKEENYDVSNELLNAGGHSSGKNGGESTRGNHMDLENLPTNEFHLEGDGGPARKRPLEEGNKNDSFMVIENSGNQPGKESDKPGDFIETNRRNNDESKGMGEQPQHPRGQHDGVNTRGHLHKSKWTSKSQESDYYNARGHRSAPDNYQESFYCQSYGGGHGRGMKTMDRMYEESSNSLCGMPPIPPETDCRNPMVKPDDLTQVDDTLSRSVDFNYDSLAESVYYQNMESGNPGDPYSGMASYQEDPRMMCRECLGPSLCHHHQGGPMCLNPPGCWPYNGGGNCCPSMSPCPFSQIGAAQQPQHRFNDVQNMLGCFLNPWNTQAATARGMNNVSVNSHAFQCLVCPMILPMCNVNNSGVPPQSSQLCSPPQMDRVHPPPPGTGNPYPLDLPPYPPPYFSPSSQPLNVTPKLTAADNAASDRDGCSCTNCSLSLGPCLILQSTTKIGWEKIYCELHK